jgi:fucose 4-O-acetylase-like acetyltransferase
VHAVEGSGELAPALSAASEAPLRASSPPGSAPRWGALDLLRFVAVLLMIQGHAFTTLLSGDYDAEMWHRRHDFVHGYTAPMFLFASGLAFGVTTFRAWDRMIVPGPALAKRLRRYATLIGIGYLLHLPALLPEDWVGMDEARWRDFLQVDVLQHVGVSLGLLQLGALVLKKPARLVALVSLLFVLVVLGAPLIAPVPVREVLPFALAGYVNSESGSMFALVPWVGFTWAGLVVAYAARTHPRPSHTWLGAIGAATLLILLVPIAINRTGWNPYGAHQFWRSSPYYFFFRLGNVMAVLAALMAVERLVDRFGLAGRFAVVRAALGLAETIGQESLVVYVAHLVVLHGCVLGPGLESVWGRALSFEEACLVTAALIVAMIALALGWHAGKASVARRRRARPG